MRITLVAIVAMAFIAQTLPTAAGSPSFDCDSAHNDIEKLICGDDELAAMDVQVAKAFANHLAKAPANLVSELKGSQTAWRKSMLGCGKTGDPRACTVAAYQSRLSDF